MSCWPDTAKKGMQPSSLGPAALAGVGGPKDVSNVAQNDGVHVDMDEEMDAGTEKGPPRAVPA